MLENAHKHQLGNLTITKRELDVCACIISGRLSRKSIANVLKVSPATVASYLRSIMQKIQCSSVDHVRSYIEASEQEEELRSYFRTINGKENNAAKFLDNERVIFSSKRANIKTLNYLASLTFIKNLIYRYYRTTYFVIGCILFLSLVYLSSFVRSSYTCPNIRSEFIVPEDKYLLRRSALISKISKELTIQSSAKENIPVVTLVGIGGAGKTTLARLIAKAHPGIAWEINAETKTTLVTSLRELAYYCVRTKVDKERIDFILTIPNESERSLQIVLFIKDKIRDNPNWLLIYDNVESFVTIKEYFPFDRKSWGHGQVIVTTRNANIQRGSCIKIQGLEEPEIVELFQNTSQQKERLSPQEKNNLLHFLRKLPPYPLDIAIAGKYLYESKAAQAEYLRGLSEKDVQTEHRKLLSEEGAYTQTRYDIIETSLNRLIKENPRYIELLLMISHMDSQNIPTKLCERLTDKSITQQFIRQMKDASLLTTAQVEYSAEPVLSLHRSIQECISIWLRNSSKVNKPFLNLFFERLALILEEYIHGEMRDERYDALYNLLPHLDRIISYMSDISSKDLKILHGAYGCLLACLEIYTENTQRYLELGLTLKDKSNHYRNSLIYYSYGCVLGNYGQYSKSIYYTKKSIEILKTRCLYSLEYFNATNYLSCMYRAVGRYEEAKQLIDEVSKLKDLYPINYRAQAEHLAQAALMLRDSGKYQEALQDMNDSARLIELRQKTFFTRSQPYYWLQTIHMELGLYDKACRGFKTFLYYGSELSMHDAKAWIGVCCYHLGKPYEALKLLEEVYTNCKQTNYICNYNAFRGYLPILGRIYIQLSELCRARKILEECLEYSERLYGTNKFQNAKIICFLGELEMAEGNLHKAEKNMLTSYHLLKEKDHTDMYVPLESLADLYWEKYKIAKIAKDISSQESFYRQAQVYLQEAARVIYDRFPQDSAHRRRIKEKMRKLCRY